MRIQTDNITLTVSQLDQQLKPNTVGQKHCWSRIVRKCRSRKYTSKTSRLTDTSADKVAEEREEAAGTTSFPPSRVWLRQPPMRRQTRVVFFPTVPAVIPGEISSSGRIHGDVYVLTYRAPKAVIFQMYIAGKCADVWRVKWRTLKSSSFSLKSLLPGGAKNSGSIHSHPTGNYFHLLHISVFCCCCCCF